MKLNKIITFSAFACVALNAQAQAIDTSFITTFGCVIYDYLTGPLSTWAFILVAIGALLMGFFSTIDWGKIVVAVAVFAVIQSIAMVMVENPTAAKYLRTASCLKSF